MEFVNRKKELEELENIYNLSKKRLFTVLITGPRRIGKTELVNQFSKNKKYLYFFTYEGKTKESLLEEFENELKIRGIIEKEVKIVDMESFIDIIFKKCEGYLVIFDEAQFMRNIYKPFFSIMQRKIDENKNKRMSMIFLGSIVGLIKKVFEDMKAPLYGRIKSHIGLKELSYRDISLLMKNLGFKNEEEIMKFYFVFGGYPKYYVAIEDYDLQGKKFLEILEYLFFRKNAPFADEVKGILRLEFGKGKGYYYDILEAISTGHTKLNEICTATKRIQTGITPFMRDLIDYYEMLSKEVPVTEDPRKSRNSIYLVRSPLFRFWFRFIHPNMRYFEKGDFDYVMQNIKENVNSFFGLRFEDVCRELIKEIKILPKFNLFGKWWHKDKEIDIVGINERTKEIIFGECKWRDNVNASRILQELKEKAEFVDWNKNKRKEQYAIFAKSFSKRTKDCYCFNLKDIVKCLHYE